MTAAPGPTRLRRLVPNLAGQRVAIFGDLVLDEYVVGRPGRISREAPVLVLDVAQRFARPGAAANPAANVAALGSQASLIGLIGDDVHGHTLLKLLRDSSLDLGGVVFSGRRPTAVKTRVLAQDQMGRSQQIVRFDDVPPVQLDAADEAALSAALERAVPQAKAVIVSDYKGGVVRPSLIAAALALASSAGIPVIVDSQGDLHRFRGCTLLKANQADAEATLGRSLRTWTDFRSAGRELLETMGAAYVVITRGADGMVAVDGRRGYVDLDATNRTEVFDVTGAGDTVIAVLTLALGAGAALPEAAALANYAAGIVVRRLGAATVTQTELTQALRGAKGAPV